MNRLLPALFWFGILLADGLAIAGICLSTTTLEYALTISVPSVILSLSIFGLVCTVSDRAEKTVYRLKCAVLQEQSAPAPDCAYLVELRRFALMAAENSRDEACRLQKQWRWQDCRAMAESGLQLLDLWRRHRDLSLLCEHIDRSLALGRCLVRATSNGNGESIVVQWCVSAIVMLEATMQIRRIYEGQYIGEQVACLRQLARELRRRLPQHVRVFERLSRETGREARTKAGKGWSPGLEQLWCEYDLSVSELAYAVRTLKTIS